jgi:alkanesulfonate monooxygenase SsuD/methylene tetrahydromethanopterin reductase-like flavin-dependent oxidoreductase (luciferase family)
VRRIAIGLGINGFPFDGPSGFWRWVDLCEAAGLDSIWPSDRLIGRDPSAESITTAAALAGRTHRLKIGLILSLGFRDPVTVAKQCATIDVLSEGRLLPIFVVGSPRAPEWEALHRPFAGQGRRADEALEIITRLWNGETVDFSGAHFTLTGASIAPTPHQSPLPLWIGGNSAPAIRRTARFGTGWQGGVDAVAIGPIIEAIRQAAIAEGRPIDADHYGASLFFHLGSDRDPALARAMPGLRKRLGSDPETVLAAGDPEVIVQRITGLIAAGVSKFILFPIADDQESLMEQTRRVAEKLLPLLPRTVD